LRAPRVFPAADASRFDVMAQYPSQP